MGSKWWVSVCVLWSACGNSAGGAKEAREDEDALTGIVVAQAEQLQDMDSTFAELKRTLELIDDREHFMKDQVRIKEPGKVMRRRLVYNMHLLNGLVAQCRRKMTDLEGRSARSTNASPSDIARLEARRKELDACSERLADLRGQMLAMGMDRSQLEQALTDAQLEVAEQEAMVEALQGDLDRVWYTVGNDKDLREMGVISQAGLLGRLVGRRALNRGSDQRSFTMSDKHRLRRIALDARRANLLTEHPDDSYRFVTDGDRLRALEIRDPDAFWRFSRYLVLEVK
ncbi:MAG: hypothetical protein H6597_01885 [Flavobacteriales bacterium]|nr:hypothetical protein [Flavobacteriales bacterium]MCB9193258.1 hypothetical protein [Flavobacteriales bacterium]